MNGSSFSLQDTGLVKALKDAIKSLGVVFGDIGTSPIYALTIIFHTIQPTVENVFGVLSLIVWTLFLLVGVGYSWLAMGLGKKGEGGTIVLRELLVPLVKSPKHVGVITIMTFLGIALFFGDGVITPAVSILSAAEGIAHMPGCADIDHGYVVLLACLVAIVLFVLQRRGTEKVSILFGPLMVVWFGVLGTSGILSIMTMPSILYAINPWYALKFILANKFTAFIVLSGVTLCATGGEGLYADMGHLGRKPIIRAWWFVFFVLILAYLGQGVFLINNPHATSVLYQLILSQVPSTLYVPFLILSIMATVVASQGMISGLFSVVYQGITTNVMPMFKVDYTSSKLRSQVYIGAINWALMAAVLIFIIKFQYSHNLASAYGLAVTGTMTLTGILMSWIFSLRKHYGKMAIAMIITCIDLVFFLSNTLKIPHGGYWSLLIASLPLTIILIYTRGQRRLQQASQPMPLELFLEKYEERYQDASKLDGSAIFFVRSINSVQPYVVQTLFENNIMYEDNILVAVITRDDPFGVIGFFKGNLAPGFRIFEIHMGYMEMLDIEKILHNAGIDACVMFYGQGEIVAKQPIWKVFSLIKRLSPSFVQFYKLPAHKLHGVVSSVEI
ncbi:KUP/HAK/KT family potassium transporter [Candidatus Dependentiae bacterium]|nr:KUP/HAK/KT family potassium transporter [Candidatus Dependentiae bacterium]